MKSKRPTPRIRVVQGASGRQELLTEDGPPDIQTVTDPDLVGDREPIVIKTEWRDPEDPNERFRKKSVRTISGWKRTWVIDRLRKSSPSEITEQHVRAATRFLDDHEIRAGAHRGSRLFERVDGETQGDTRIINGHVAAGVRIDETKAALGQEAFGILFRIVVLNWTVATLAVKAGTSPDRAFGRVRAALERLREHYWPPSAGTGHGGDGDADAIVDAGVVDIGQDRLGRVRRVAMAEMTT